MLLLRVKGDIVFVSLDLFYEISISGDLVLLMATLFYLVTLNRVHMIFFNVHLFTYSTSSLVRLTALDFN